MKALPSDGFAFQTLRVLECICVRQRRNCHPLGVQNSRAVSRGSLIMSICATVGRPVISDIDVCIHDGFVVFENLRADKRFLYYILKSIGERLVASRADGLTNEPKYQTDQRDRGPSAVDSRRTIRDRRPPLRYGRGHCRARDKTRKSPHDKTRHDAGTANRKDAIDMSDIGKPERATQNRVAALFRDELKYRYLGDWTDRDGNSNIEEGLLSTWLTKNKYTPEQISVVLHKLRTEADNYNRIRFTATTRLCIRFLRYGVPVKIEAGKATETVHLINWSEPEQNDFAVAEEVTLERQPRAKTGSSDLRQWNCHRRAGIEKQPRHHWRRHPPIAFQPAERVQRVVLRHSPDCIRRQ